MQLYQFTISHYCEKARWALDYKQKSYQLTNLLGGLHLLKTRRLGKKTYVPLLVDEGRVVQGSNHIIDYLESLDGDFKLNPSKPAALKQALEWEHFADIEIGITLRRFFYFYVLRDPTLSKSLLSQDGPWYTPLYMFVMFYPMRIMMKKGMNIFEQPSLEARQKLTASLDRLNKELKGKEYLAGDNFSRADISVASLLAPLFTPLEHQYRWPSPTTMPKPLQEFKQHYQGSRVESWVLEMYRKHRGREAQPH